MIKRTIKYKNLDGKEVVEDFYFHLSYADLAELEVDTPTGFGDYFQEILEKEDKKEMFSTFKNLIVKAYGKRSEDGAHFVKETKDEKFGETFLHHMAFDVLFMDLMTDPKFAAEFFNGMMPDDLQKRTKALNKANKEMSKNFPESEKTPASLGDLANMPKEKLVELLSEYRQK